MRMASLWIIGLFCAHSGQASDLSTIDLYEKGARTYYTTVNIAGFEEEFMIDTGSGYTAINESLSDKLAQIDAIEYTGRVRGIMADHSTYIFPVGRVTSMVIGNCVLRDVSVAVFPGKTRMLLGLSALESLSPFTFSFHPPRLSFANCVTAAHD